MHFIYFLNGGIIISKLKGKLIIGLIVFIFMVLIYAGNNIYKQSAIYFDNTIESDAQFIDTSESKRFSYNTQVLVNGIKSDNGFTSVQFRITIEPKKQAIYEHVVATVFLDPAIKPLLFSKTFLTFGSDPTSKPTIGVPDSKGIIIERATWVYPDKDQGVLINELKKAIKIKVSWDGGTEYSIVDPQNIEIILK